MTAAAFVWWWSVWGACVSGGMWYGLSVGHGYGWVPWRWPSWGRRGLRFAILGGAAAGAYIGVVLALYGDTLTPPLCPLC